MVFWYDGIVWWYPWYGILVWWYPWYGILVWWYSGKAGAGLGTLVAYPFCTYTSTILFTPSTTSENGAEGATGAGPPKSRPYDSNVAVSKQQTCGMITAGPCSLRSLL